MTDRGMTMVEIDGARITLPALRCPCGSPDWFACAPGTAAETADPAARIVPLHPAPEIPTKVWCAACWPWSRPARRPLSCKATDA
ncbi:hypothetical protein [Rhodopila sp.]|uniref:hypothetical protein n=1 Tax=Rhodopila sp. TaxID=2480087 RepID=UPI003D10F9C9